MNNDTTPAPETDAGAGPSDGDIDYDYDSAPPHGYRVYQWVPVDASSEPVAIDGEPPAISPQEAQATAPEDVTASERTVKASRLSGWHQGLKPNEQLDFNSGHSEIPMTFTIEGDPSGNTEGETIHGTFRFVGTENDDEQVGIDLLDEFHAAPCEYHALANALQIAERDLADAAHTKRTSTDAAEWHRVEIELAAIERAGGAKNLGANAEERERVLSAAVIRDARYIQLHTEMREWERRLDNAAARCAGIRRRMRALEMQNEREVAGLGR